MSFRKRLLKRLPKNMSENEDEEMGSRSSGGSDVFNDESSGGADVFNDESSGGSDVFNDDKTERGERSAEEIVPYLARRNYHLPVSRDSWIGKNRLRAIELTPSYIIVRLVRETAISKIGSSLFMEITTPSLASAFTTNTIQSPSSRGSWCSLAR